MSTPVSLQDVARAAGVHRSTVCRILTGRADRDRICPATQAHVRSVARELGYVRKPAILFPEKPVAPPQADAPMAHSGSDAEVVPVMVVTPTAVETRGDTAGTNAAGTSASSLAPDPAAVTPEVTSVEAPDPTAVSEATAVTPVPEPVADVITPEPVATIKMAEVAIPEPTPVTPAAAPESAMEVTHQRVGVNRQYFAAPP